MKTFLPMLLTLALSPLAAFAAPECPYALGESYLEQVAQGIEAAADCDAGVALAKACALGSSGDSFTMSVAAGKCEKSFAVNPKDAARYSAEKNNCINKYMHVQGTIGYSLLASCAMEAARVIRRQWSCEAAAQVAAQKALDREAESAQFDASDVGPAEFYRSFKDSKGPRYVYRALGAIYKASYQVDITTDTKCAVAKTSVRDLSVR